MRNNYLLLVVGGGVDFAKTLFFHHLLFIHDIFRHNVYKKIKRVSRGYSYYLALLASFFIYKHMPMSEKLRAICVNLNVCARDE